jgi:hypothetical protein
VGDVPGEHLAPFLVVRGAQVDLVVGAVQAEPDRAFGRAAVDVVDIKSGSAGPYAYSLLRGLRLTHVAHAWQRVKD